MKQSLVVDVLGDLRDLRDVLAELLINHQFAGRLEGT